MDEKDFFVGIHEPSDIRRNVLESSKDVVNSMQTNEILKQIRKEKLLLFEKMRSVMNDLDLLVSKLNKKLPKTHLRKNVVIKTPAEIKELENRIRKIESEFNKI